MTTIDRLLVRDLPERYGITRSVVYQRLHALGIQPEKSGRRSYVSGRNLELLDQLDRHLKQGGLTDDFIDQLGGQTTTKHEPDNGQTDGAQPAARPANNDLQASDDLGERQAAAQSWLQETVAAAVSATLAHQLPPSDPVQDLETLQRIADRGWRLPTARIAAIIGRSPKTLARHQSLDHCGFTIRRAGKQGSQLLWEVLLTQNG